MFMRTASLLGRSGRPALSFEPDEHRRPRCERSFAVLPRRRCPKPCVYHGPEGDGFYRRFGAPQLPRPCAHGLPFHQSQNARMRLDDLVKAYLPICELLNAGRRRAMSFASIVARSAGRRGREKENRGDTPGACRQLDTPMFLA